jgi:predicted RNA-binding protein with PUA-like domain
MPRFWLLKCEPDVYSIADLARDGRTGWDGVRNHQVRNFMRDEMRPGDLGIFYHSNATPPGAAGVVEILRTGLADPSQFDPKSDYHDAKSDPAAPTWIMCEVGFVEAFAAVVPLERLRAEPALAEMLILRRGNRLSVTPLTEGEFRAIRALGLGALGSGGLGSGGSTAGGGASVAGSGAARRRGATASSDAQSRAAKGAGTKRSVAKSAAKSTGKSATRKPATKKPAPKKPATR